MSRLSLLHLQMPGRASAPNPAPQGLPPTHSMRFFAEEGCLSITPACACTPLQRTSSRQQRKASQAGRRFKDAQRVPLRRICGLSPRVPLGDTPPIRSKLFQGPCEETPRGQTLKHQGHLGQMSLLCLAELWPARSAPSPLPGMTMATPDTPLTKRFYAIDPEGPAARQCASCFHRSAQPYIL